MSFYDLLVAEQIINAGFASGLLINAFDDDGARQAWSWRAIGQILARHCALEQPRNKPEHGRGRLLRLCGR